MANWRRTHTCGELHKEHVGQTITLNGWVHTYRAYNDQIFVDLRDRYGITQVVFEADNKDLFAESQAIRNEWVLSVEGEVVARLPGKTNPKLASGEIEVKAKKLHILNRCPTPPFQVTEFPDEELAGEDLRLQYRYLDLRRETLHKILGLRHKLCKVIRDFLDQKGFLEIETPLLGKSSPEGARDYLVPSRIFPGNWYALPQSPQLYKQLLMISGYDKYFQIARCLRDEDLRADRQPEFTQLDIETAFVDIDSFLQIMEEMVAYIFKEIHGFEVQLPLPRMDYQECMLKYGSDRPDLRYEMPIVELTDMAPECGFKIFQDAAAKGRKVRGINAKGGAGQFSNTDLNKGSLLEFVKGFGAKGLAWLKVEGGKFIGSIEKNFTQEAKEELRKRFAVEDGDLLMFIADEEDLVCSTLGGLRSHLAEKMGLYTNWWDRRQQYEEDLDQYYKDVKDGRPATEPGPFAFQEGDFNLFWVIDFPSFLWDEDEKRWVANHHPFTSPREEDIPLLEADPGKVVANAYDLILNGYELGGGSIRIHNPEVQKKVFKVLGMEEEEAKERFGFLLDALKFGAPPHGGIAFGLDRMVMMLAGTTNIRDVIAFPKNQKARDLMTGAPAEVDAKQLKELGL